MSVSVQQAAANAAVAYLKTQLPGIAIHSRWPQNDFPGTAITLITAGARQDWPAPPRVLSKTNLGSTQTVAVWQLAECTQPFQLDVWSTSFSERDSLMAQLDQALRSGFGPLTGITNKDPFGNGFFVDLADGWESLETTAKFSFYSQDTSDSPDQVIRDQFRATYRGNAYMKLAFSAVSPRQKQFTLKAFLDGANQPSTDTTLP